ncbi:O-antigen ligase family protein [Costertonia aggregata]|uniref:O-antigen ligase family protein n=1 Tax=Costertonia aggregata TaxID=343403 RepID=A0A7H9AP85_9FLAO|nr:O-antigen ligase family protein [Costertonia aggregata]QLG45237.1 O-antigen ligase family protein [Costertonia aggregata]
MPYKTFFDFNNVILFSLGCGIFILPYDLNLNSYCIVFTFLAWLYGVVKGKVLFKDFKILAIHSFPFLIAVLGLVYTSNVEYGFNYLTRVSSFLILPVIFGTVSFKARQYDYLQLAFVFGCVVFFLNAILYFFNYDLSELLTGISEENFLFKFNQFFSKEVMHPTYYATFFLLNIFSLSYFFMKEQSFFIKSFILLLIFIVLVFLVSLTAKMPIISLVAVLFFVPIFYLVKNFKFKILILYIFLLGSVLMLVNRFLMDVPNRAVQEAYDYYNYLTGKKLENYYEYKNLQVEYDSFWFKKTNRVVIWKNSLELAKESPFIGYGTGDVQDKLIDTYKKNNELWRMQFFNSHNQFLDYQLRYGLPGVLLLIAFLFYYFRYAWLNIDFLYLSFLIIITMGFLSENFIQRHWGIVFFTFFNSLFYYRIKQLNTKQ